jgi:TolB protein
LLIAFRSDATGDDEIHVMTADGTSSAQVTTSPGFDDWPTFSPDDTAIAFDSDRNGSTDVYLLDVDGTEQNLTADEPATDIMPDWQPLL